jgi:Asp-tRNA(Asn)/Glu-tRNA(Gln) amidotransferase A subunit family amidase
MMPGNSSALVTRLLEAHGVVLGKMRMHELAYGGTSINVHGGPVLNPYNNTMHVGGSSGGTCAAVAMRMAPAGFCSDTGAAR